jgi:hypothetical protein
LVSNSHHAQRTPAVRHHHSTLIGHDSLYM